VHRVPGGRRGAVFAFRHEIDTWLRSRELGADRDPAAASHPAITGPAPSTARKGAGRSVRVAAAVAAVLCLLVAAVVAATWGSRPGAGARSAAPPRLDKLGYDAREIVARASDGTVLWRYTTPRAIVTPILETGSPPWYALADLDDDGRPEVLATVPLAVEGAEVPGQDLARDELHCFSADGRLLWKVRLEDELSFRAGHFGPPWLAGRVVAYRTREGWRIAWTQAHHTWWPSLLVVLDAKGTRLSTFVHAGSIRALLALESNGRTYLLAGGVANPYRAAFLALLDAEAVRGHGPVPAGSAYECLGCSEELPLRYFLFPPSDINQVSGLPYNSLVRIVPFGDEVEAFTMESNGNESSTAEMNFRFSRDLRLLDARSSDSFAAHEQYERAGRLDHPVARCPWYRRPPPVREWTAAEGWRDIRPLGPESAAGAEPPPAHRTR
jgi:hypothetical protein